MRKVKDKVSTMQREVWKMKDIVFKETKNMNCHEFFYYIEGKSKASKNFRKEHAKHGS